MKVAYVDHPCSKEKKEELKAQGYRVVDSRFKPKELADDDIVADKSSRKRSRRDK